MTNRYHNSPKSLNVSYATAEIENQRQTTLAALAVQPGESVLDVGCGTGFLTKELAKAVGSGGSVLGLDVSAEMVQAAQERCRELPQATFMEKAVTCLDMTPAQFDVITCAQVLLYVDEVEKALTQMEHVLRPGGRLAILETDWRGLVLNSRYPDLTETIYRAWDAAVPSPNLPVRLGPLMRDAGLEQIKVSAVPLLTTVYSPKSFSFSTMRWLANNAVQAGCISPEESRMWQDDLKILAQNGAYFFCVNRFLFIGHKF